MIASPWAPGRLLPEEPLGGVLRAVPIPDTSPPPEAIARLLPEERAVAAELPPARRATWVAGRIALSAALADLGAPREPLLATPRGAPAVPAGLVGSIAHKRRVAVAFAALAGDGHVGVDVEEARPPRFDLSARILTATERASVERLPVEARWRLVLVRFSIKESIYKAVDPFVQRYVGFQEAEVDLGPPVRARLDPVPGEGPFSVEAAWVEIDGLFVSTARARVEAGSLRSG